MMQRRGSVNNSAASARIRVAVRVRPPDCKIPKDETRPPCVAPSPNPNTPNALEFRHDTQTKTFTFDHVHGSSASQDDVYAGALQPLLAQFLDGYNVTVMAYGQTGSGKTYTMGNRASVFNTTPTTSPCRDRGSSIPPPMITTPETRSYQGSANDGLMPRFLNDLFVSLKREPSVKEIRVTFVEIYLDTIRDLLDDRPDKSLSIREDTHNVWVENVRSVQVDTLTRALEVLNAGRARQTVGKNALNDESSRSHAVYTMEVSRKFSSEMKKSKLTFVDLAGSERIKKTEVEGPRRRESIQINVGLSSLGNVINALADQRKLQQRRMSQDSSTSRPSSPDVHIPYRSSKLTRLLRDGLGGNARTLIIACVSPLDSNADETINTLQFANRARSIQNKAEKNVNHELYVVTPNASELEISRLQENVKALQQQISDLEAASRKREEEIASAEQARIQRKEKKRDDRRDAEMTTEVVILPHVDAHTQHEGESTGEKRPTIADADTMTDCFDDTPAKTATVDVCVQFGVTSSELVDMAIMTDPDRRCLATETCTVFDLVATSSVDMGNQFGVSYLHLNDMETGTDLDLYVATCDASTEYFTAEITDSACQHDPPAPFADAETVTDSRPVVETAEISTECALQLVQDSSSQSDASCLHNVDVSVSTDSFPESVVKVADGTALVDTASQHESPISTDAGVEAIPEAVEVGTESVAVPVAEIACQAEIDMPDHVEIGTITDPEAIAHTTDASTDCVLVATTDEASQCSMSASDLIEFGMTTDLEPVVSTATVSTECPVSDLVHTASQCDHASHEDIGVVSEADQSTDLLRTEYVSIVDKSGDAVLHSNIDGTVSPAVSNIARPDVLADASEDGPDDCFPAGVHSEDAHTSFAPPACLSPTSSISTLSDTCDITPSVDTPAAIGRAPDDKKLSVEDLITDESESSNVTELWKSVKRPDLSLSKAFEPAMFSSFSDLHATQDVFDVTRLVYDTVVLEAAAEVKSTKVTRSLTPEAEEDEQVHVQSENQREVGAGDHMLFVCSPLNEGEEDMLGVQTVATRCIVNSEPVFFEVAGTGPERDDCTSGMEYASMSDFIPSTISLAIKPPAIQDHDQNACDAVTPHHLDYQDIPLPPPAADFVVVRSPRRGNRAKPQGAGASQRISSRGALPKRAMSPSSHQPLRPLRIFAFDDDVTAATPEKTAAQAKNLCENLRQLARDEFGGDTRTAEPDELQQAPVLHALSTVGRLITETKEFINRRQKRQQRIAQLRRCVLELEDVLQVKHRAPISEPELKAYSERVQEEFLCKLSQQLITLAAERLHTRLKARVEAEQLMPLPSGADDDDNTTSPFLNLDQCQPCAEWFFRRADDAVFFEKQVLPLITSGWIPLSSSHLEAEQAWFQL